MNSKKELALKTVFKCGICDLSIIDDTNADVEDYLESTDCPSLEDFVAHIVKEANAILKKEWHSQKEEIMCNIKDLKQDIIKECGEDYFDENPHDDEVEAIDFFENQADTVINKGFSLYFNFLDTHISIPYAYILEEYHLFDEVNDFIGFTSVETTG